MKRKVFILCVLFVLLIFAATSCAAPSTSTATTPSPTTSSPSPTPSGGKLKVAFVYIAPIGDSGWTYEHNQGRLYLEEQVSDLETSYVESVPEGVDSVKVIRDFAQKGYDVIITTSYGYMNPTIEVAREFPNVIFLHCSGNKTAENVGTYFGRIEEPRYLSGLVAGKMTRSNLLGYVAAFPNPEVIRGINAFTLGVRAVNPEAEVRVVWTNTWNDSTKERQAAGGLIDVGCDVIAQHQDTTGPQQAAEARGVYGVGYNSDMSRFAPHAVLTSPVWKWGIYYVEAIKRIKAGTWESEQYWGGMKDGIVDLTPMASFVPEDVQNLVFEKRDQILKGTFDILSIFSGPLKDQKGEVKVPEGAKMTGEEILNMNWFVEGVLGEIPAGG